MVRWLVMVAALAGCDNVFGLHELAGPDGRTSGDGGLQTVTGTRVRSYIFNDASGATAVGDVAYATGELTVAASLRDGTPIPVTLTDPAAAAFSFAAPAGEVYTVAFSTGGPVAEYELSAPTVTTADVHYGRPDAIPATAGTALEIDALSFMPTEAQVVTTGSWTQLGASISGASATASWPTGAFIVDGSKGDRAYLVNLTSQGTYKNLDHIAQTAPVVMQPGATTKVPSNVATQVNPSSCKHMDIDASLLLRTKHTGFPMAGAYWQLFATPAPQFGANAGLNLAISTSPVAANAQYKNVFPSTQTVASFVALATRTVTGGAVLGYAAGKYVNVADDSACAAPDPVVHVGVPGVPSFEGAAITTDDTPLTVAPDVQRMVFTWDLETPGQVDYYLVQLLEVPASGPTVVRRSTSTIDAQVVYDPAVFEAGHRYVLDIQSVLGAPHASSGDFTTIAATAEFAFAPSPTFTVAR